MKVAITGSSGLVGTALLPFLTTGGHDVVRLVRRVPAGKNEARWDPDAGTIDAAALEGLDAVAHLDCVMRDATLELDGRPVMVAGELV